MRSFYGTHAILVASLLIVLVFSGIKAAFLVLVLAVLEISLSVDNAVVNAGVLKNMEEIWQKRFLTWGMVIAVFGMRLIFPVLVVALATGMSANDVVLLALNSPDQYALYLHEAHPMIAALGGMFLMMVGLSFLLDDSRDVLWVGSIEKRLQSLGKIDAVNTTITLGTLLSATAVVPGEMKMSVLTGGIWGIFLFGFVSSLDSLFAVSDEQVSMSETVKKGGLIGFLYLELLDASFSFDGVIGAFAISKEVQIIMIGLGIGALYVRSLTIYLVNKGILDEYIYLEHGAHYAILALAILMLGSIVKVIPEVITGVTGALVIGLSLWSSIYHNKQKALLAPTESPKERYPSINKNS
ncbi:DUF475 domain-containing protein [Methylicorpusculum sp.]|uniref:DUF475 domain-containing protein n=1 Tax=Methylicorpusculum sp. TaxID=2713644 RepID=UPI00271EDD83|nr:DUF475 domain-containing protein [Methylicorpusculum sp.]MDO8845324.1 DUF475 domain-containing protein [Methylicorpusculum sp.]